MGFLEKHPKLAIATVVLIGLLLVVVSAELSLRFFGSLNIHYYTGHSKPGMHEYPYGTIPINSDGSPDEEFIPVASKKRIGYFGDSVTYGVGVGYGHRIPDLLQATFPAYQHWVFAQVGAVPQALEVSREITKHQLSTVVYLMNLNDILPDEQSPEVLGVTASELSKIATRTSFLGRADEALRGRSYLYTYVRLGLKNALQRAGYEAHGQLAYELRPKQHHRVVSQTAERVVKFSEALSSQGVKVCVILLPYEMQVSSDAALTYARLGFSWEEGFLEGSTQVALLQPLRQGGVNVYDAREAFSGLRLKVGEAFVYDKGDKIDWNHPNRFGHARIAAWLSGLPAFWQQCLPG